MDRESKFTIRYLFLKEKSIAFDSSMLLLIMVFLTLPL